MSFQKRSYMLNKRLFYLLLIILFIFTNACSIYGVRQGVDNKWRDESVPEFKKGVTTQSEVTEYLGPPSQLISLRNETVFYYLLEGSKGKALFLLLFNYRKENVTYDRAIFFFDKKGLLTDYAYSVETIKYKPKPE